MRTWLLAPILIVGFAGPAWAPPYGTPPAAHPPAPSGPIRAPDSSPRIPNAHGVPRSVLDRTHDNAAGLQEEFDDRIEAAITAEAEAYRILQSAYAGVGNAEDEATRTRREYLDVRGWGEWGADPYGDIEPEAEGAWLEAQQRLRDETSLLQDALDDHAAAQALREELEALHESGPALAELLGSSPGPPDATPVPSPPPQASTDVGAAPQAAADPPATPEQDAHDAYRAVLGDFADGEATIEDVEAAHAALVDARAAAGW